MEPPLKHRALMLLAQEKKKAARARVWIKQIAKAKKAVKLRLNAKAKKAVKQKANAKQKMAARVIALNN